MWLRRAVTRATTLVVAVVVALAVPVTQLRTVSVTTSCCCPDPSNCHCPDHKVDHSNLPSIRVCHKSSHESVSPQLPSFTPAVIAIAIAAPRIARPTMIAPRVPHAPPAADEPYGPS